MKRLTHVLDDHGVSFAATENRILVAIRATHGAEWELDVKFHPGEAEKAFLRAARKAVREYDEDAFIMARILRRKGTIMELAEDARELKEELEGIIEDLAYEMKAG